MKRVLCVVQFLIALAAAGTARAWTKPPFESVGKNHDG